MKVWRIEHHCSQAFGHGPWNHECDDFADRPDYGTRLSPPNCDEWLQMVILRDEVVGTRYEQFDLWWARHFTYNEDGTYDWTNPVQRYEVQRELRGDWFACLYEVPEEDVRAGRDQLVFKRSRAQLIFKSQTVFPDCDKPRIEYSLPSSPYNPI